MSESSPLSVTPNASDDQNTWETVTFPNAISTDELLEQEDDTPVQPSLVSGDSFLRVQQDNQELRDQIAALEAALVRSQNSLRLEMERWEALALAQPNPNESSEIRLQNQNQELSSSQARLGQLFIELEQSHRMAQRQQILVETLTDQLQASHEQIAQLERECASAQQRAAEQAQLVLQSEHACRDLRSRLHRQQRYTLQFKAALEKCLDVPPATAQGFVTDFIEDAPEAETVASAAAKAPPKVKMPRSQPVQPWSSTVRSSEADTAAPPLQSWVGAVVSEPTVTESEVAEAEIGDAVNEAVPEPWDESACESVNEPVPESIRTAVSEAQVSEPVSESISESISESVSESQVSEPATKLPIDLEAVVPNPHMSESDRLDSWAQVMAQVNAIVGENVTLVERDPAETSELANPPQPIAPVIAKANTSAKKRTSLAAVELPTFRRSDA